MKDKWANYCLTYKRNYVEALEEYLDLKKFLLSTKEDEEAENASTIFGIACSYFGLADYDKALSTHLSCCKQRENLLEDDPIQVSINEINIQIFYYKFNLTVFVSSFI